MDHLIRKLPLEIQSLIRDDMPFCRLSKQHYCGKNKLLQLSQKKISQKEFMRYLDECQPDYFFMYYSYENHYHIVEVNTTEDFYCIADHHLSNIALSRHAHVIPKDKLDHLLHPNLEYDLISSKNILQMRGIYFDPHLLLMNQLTAHLFEKNK